MSSEQFTEGRKKALQDIAGIIKTNRDDAAAADLSGFTGGKKIFTKPEAGSCLKDELSRFYDHIESGLSALQNGKTTEDLRGIPSHYAEGDTYNAGQVSAYRDIYNLVKDLDADETISPVPSTITRLQKKSFAMVEADIIAFAQNQLLHDIAVKGETVSEKHRKECERARAKAAKEKQSTQQHAYRGNLNQDFNGQNQKAPPKRDYTGIDVAYIEGFDDKNLLHPTDTDEAGREYIEHLQEIVTVIENYKSAIKKKDFANITGYQTPARRAGRATAADMASSHKNFCRTHSYEVIRTVRDALVALMKGADPHKICRKIPANDNKAGREKAFSDAGHILEEINPAHFEITHSHGYRLSVDAGQVSRLAVISAESTTREMGSLVKALANAGSAHLLLQTGILDTITRSPQQINRDLASRLRAKRNMDFHDPS